MTNLELKAQIKCEIDNEQNNAILEKIQKYYLKLKKAEKKRPCVMTSEELQQDALQAIDDVKNGRVISQEQLLDEIAAWE